MKLAYIDSCVYISRVEGIPEYQTTIEKELQQLARDGCVSCISELVSLEVFLNPLKKGQHELGRQYQSLFGKITTLPAYPGVFADALRIALSENLKAMDAIHVAVAQHYQCELFVSSDPHFRSLTTITPYWINLSGQAPAVQELKNDTD